MRKRDRRAEVRYSCKKQKAQDERVVRPTHIEGASRTGWSKGGGYWTFDEGDSEWMKNI